MKVGVREVGQRVSQSQGDPLKQENLDKPRSLRCQEISTAVPQQMSD